MKKIKKQFLLVFLMSAVFSTSKAQQFLNGSFENCTAFNSIININNAIFNSYFSHVKGIGELETLDIIYDVGWVPPFYLAQNGHYYVSVESDNADSNLVTTISMELSDTFNCKS